MKNLYTPQGLALSICSLFLMLSFNTFAQVGIGTTSPDSGSILDISSTNKGVLLPRIDIANLNSLSPLTSGAEGMLVYNTNTSTGPGFVFWNGSSWTPVGDGNGTDAWGRTGNTGTIPGTGAGQNYLGTSNSQDLVIATDGAERMRVLSNGNVGIGVNNPRTSLDIEGALSLREGAIITLSNGNNTNISLGTTPHSIYRINGPTSAFTINSIVPINNSDGQLITLINNTNQLMTLSHNSGGSGANRINVPGATDLILRGQYASVTLQYNTNYNRWVVLNEVNHIETFYGPLPFIANGLNVYTFNVTGVTASSTVSANLVGPVPAAIANNLSVENVEARPDVIVLRIYNYGGLVTNGAVALGINKI
ncbi:MULTISPECIES: hypothetical protein [Aequorivita]|uniref:Uncharacterized protein n=1 Tax=Aequorivita iocasae TaxID=2803865 RepID=A0ABX7DT71_9FLAO|nr:MULTISPECIES: hypothetical protein [Aequorivita]QQX76816.1 hypothetical protein JK629_00645 [Aequorivita iocasae]UCA56288.1 hypothetical protein LDL78_00650 [Aequorivita sp. F7]